jgi:multimeric flavodoxin WrbA
MPYPDSEERKLLKEIIGSLKNAKQLKQFTPYEMKQLSSAMHIFFEEFRFYYHLFKGQKTKTLLFICHYHSEGLIAALKILGIKCIEVQHGLIATNDLYYVYHEQFSSAIGKALFPDKILTYGPYWKRILGMGCEFRTSQILVAGDYLYRLKESKIEKPEKENIVLVCAQKTLHTDYVNYGKKLAEHLKKHPEWRAILKLHPLEKNKQAYEELRQYGIEIVDVEVPLDILLAQCKIQISIYSTTFYDALGFDMVNFSLQDFGSMSDYASDMIQEGVAAPIMANEDPIDKYLHTLNSGQMLLAREEVYAPFNPELIHTLIFDN